MSYGRLRVLRYVPELQEEALVGLNPLRPGGGDLGVERGWLGIRIDPGSTVHEQAAETSSPRNGSRASRKNRMGMYDCRQGFNEWDVFVVGRKG